MKNRILTSLVLLLLTAFQSAAGSSPFKFDSTVWDWGIIREADGLVSHSFHFINISSKPVCIYQLSVSCGCTKPEWSRSLIEPGASSQIKISFNPTGYKGAVSKTVSVRSSENTIDVLTVRCEVIPTERALEIAFPILLRGGLRLSADHLSFGQIRQGQSKTMKLGVANSSEQPIRIEAVPEGKSGLLEAVTPIVLEPGARDSLKLCFSLPVQSTRFGVIEDALILKSEGLVCGRLPVSMIGTDQPIPDIPGGQGPKMRVNSQYENLGTISRESGVARKDFEISNIGTAPLKIRDIHVPECIEKIRPSKTLIAPGEKITITIVLHPELCGKPKVFETVYITANDAEHPVREIMIAASIK